MKKKDYVANILQEWYDESYKNGVPTPTPKAATIIGTILARYNVQPKPVQEPMEDIFNQYMNTKGGDWQAFWAGLSADEKEYIEMRRQQIRDEYYASRNLVDDQKKSLLKG